MHVIVNGQAHELDAENTSLFDLLQTLGLNSSWQAVVVDAELIPKSQHVTFELTDGARVEVVTPMQGG
jgi:sulfur carrier protein